MSGRERLYVGCAERSLDERVGDKRERCVSRSVVRTRTRFQHGSSPRRSTALGMCRDD